MDKNDLYTKYIEAHNFRLGFESAFKEYVDRWKSGDTPLRENDVEDLIKKGNDKIEELKQKEYELYNEYNLNQEYKRK